MLSRKIHVLACAAGLIVLCGLYWQRWQPISHATRDFTAFYVAGQTVGHGAIYAQAPYMTAEKDLGTPRYWRLYLRFPWQALMVKPFTLLPYRAAAWAWNGLMILGS